MVNDICRSFLADVVQAASLINIHAFSMLIVFLIGFTFLRLIKR